jgi:outer membrane protein assembly factor BamA
MRFIDERCMHDRKWILNKVMWFQCGHRLLQQWKLISVFLLILGGAPGCRHRTDPDAQFREGKQIGSIQFLGNRALSSELLRAYLPIQRKDYFLTETESAVFDILLQAYASHGYYHAVLDKVDVVERRNRLHIRVHLREGLPTIVRSIRFEYTDAPGNRKRFEADLPLKEGEAADIEKLNQSVALIKERLANDGRALGEVNESMVVIRDEYAADVVFKINAGPICRVDHIGVIGLIHAPEDLVYDELEEFEGQVYTPEVARAIEENLAELNAFRMITVSPVANDRDRGLVDLEIAVVEADFRSLKLGVGVQFETNKFLGWTSAVYQNNNYFHRLNQFQLKSRLGWALVPALWKVEDQGPVVLLEPSVTRTGFVERHLKWNWALGLQTDVEENYKLFSPSSRLSVSRNFFRHLNIRLSYNFEYIVLYGVDDFVMERLQRDYEDMRSPIRLAELNASARLWFTDTRDDPDNGAVFRFNYWHSGRYLASEVSYNKYSPSISTYWRIFPFLQVALHGEVGFIFPFGSADYSGIRANFFLGGHNTVRGWGGKRLAPWVRICADGAPRNCEKIWIGGKTMVQGNVELRFRMNDVVSAVVFLDLGDVQYDIRTIVPNDWNYSVGSGVRVSTPIGKIRFDVGFRLNEPPQYREERRFGVHLGLGEAF